VLTAIELETLGATGAAHAPVNADIFEAYRRVYAYDSVPLNALVESVETTSDWIRQTVSLDAAYGGERLQVLLFIPRSVTPPYQVVVFFPSADALDLRSSGDMTLAWVDLIVRGGRTVAYPIYKGTYERGTSGVDGPAAARDLRIAWSRDLGRTLDYLQTRPDLSPQQTAFYGVSLGGDAGVVLVALEPRFKAAIFQGSGLMRRAFPEIDPVNFAPRVTIPSLMLNGRYDFERPYLTSQQPLFDLLGTPADRKRHLVVEAGHSLAVSDVAAEIGQWLDRYLGTVATAKQGRR
jgi:dienelactone hydrolase